MKISEIPFDLLHADSCVSILGEPIPSVQDGFLFLFGEPVRSFGLQPTRQIPEG